MVCVAARRDLTFSSLVAWPLEFSCGFSPTGICSQDCPRSHESAPARKGYRSGGGCGCKSAYYWGDRVRRMRWQPLGLQRWGTGAWGSLQLHSQESQPRLEWGALASGHGHVKVSPDGSLPNAQWGRGQCMVTEAANVALGHHSNGALRLWSPGLHHKHSGLWVSSLLSPQAVSSQLTAVPFPDVFPNPCFRT